MINFGRIEEDLFIGNAPQNSVDISRLKQMEVTAVLSLQSDQDFKSHKIDWKKLQSVYQYSEIVVRRFPIIDFDEADLAKRLADPVRSLNDLLGAGQRVYVHCNAGVCRAPATVLTYLCHYRGMELAEGLEFIRLNRPQAHPYLSAVQRALIELAGTGQS